MVAFFFRTEIVRKQVSGIGDPVRAGRARERVVRTTKSFCGSFAGFCITCGGDRHLSGAGSAESCLCPSASAPKVDDGEKVVVKHSLYAIAASAVTSARLPARLPARGENLDDLEIVVREVDVELPAGVRDQSKQGVRSGVSVMRPVSIGQSRPMSGAARFKDAVR